MKYKTIILVLLAISALAVFYACDEKPTDPKYDNPFDPQNTITEGDPFKLDALIANGGITLNWTAANIKGLQNYKIYKSENESSGYNIIETVSNNTASYIDTAIANGHSYWYNVTAASERNTETKRTNTVAVNIKTRPVLAINSGEQYTTAKEVSLTILATSAQKMMLSNNRVFSGAVWENYNTNKSWTLTTGAGLKSVYMKVKYDSAESEITESSILPQPTTNISIIIGESDTTNTLDVDLNVSADYATKMMIGNDSLFTNIEWEDYKIIKTWHLDYSKVINSTAKVYAKFQNDFEMETSSVKDEVFLLIVAGIKINGDSTYTMNRLVNLNLFSDNADQVMISDKEDFSGSEWEVYAERVNWTLPTGKGPFKLFAKFKNNSGLVSDVYSDEISPQPINPAILIAGGNEYSVTRDVLLSISATGTNLQMKLNEDSTFKNENWRSYSATPRFQLSIGDGTKNIFAKVQNDFMIESDITDDQIVLDTTPPNILLTVSPGSGITSETDFQFDPTSSNDILTAEEDLQLRFDWENDGSFDTGWTQLSTISHQYSVGGGNKTVKMQLKDRAGWQVETNKNIFVNTRPVASFTATEINLKRWFFDASASSDYEDGVNIEYRWDFDGDGSWDTAWLAKDTMSYVYANSGDYDAKLSVRDQNSLSVEHVVEVSGVSTMTDIDGNVYEIVGIGNQIWMAENLKVTHYRNGEPIPHVPDSSTWLGLSNGAYCAYNNDNANVGAYGLLYKWYTLYDSRNIAPDGWHVPTDEEWKQLEMYIGMSQADAGANYWRGTDEGGKLKETGTTHWDTPNIGATNESGFSALPGGYRSEVGIFSTLGSTGYWWTSYRETQDRAFRRRLGSWTSATGRYKESIKRGYSVRLVRD